MNSAAMETLIAAVVLFTGGHFVLSAPPVRRRLIGVLGERGFLGGYSVLMIGLLVWAALAYRTAPYLELWPAPFWLRVASLPVMAVATILVVAALSTPNPTAVGGERLYMAEDPVPGIFKVTRHPMMWGIALWALAHIATNGDLASVVLFGGLLALALLGPLHMDRRRLADDPDGYGLILARTSYLPFVAIAQGRTHASLDDVAWWRLILGLAVFALLLALHRPLIGVYPLG